MDVELKPCPFCGAAAELKKGVAAFEDWEVQCTGCGISGLNFGSIEQDDDAMFWAADSWNTRAPSGFQVDRECRREIEGDE